MTLNAFTALCNNNLISNVHTKLNKRLSEDEFAISDIPVGQQFIDQ